MDSTLLYILLANLVAGLVSIFGAALLSFHLLTNLVKRMVSFSVGLLLSTAFLHALPEAFESDADPHLLCSFLLFGLLGFFLLERLTLLRHSHHHEGDGHGHHHGHDAESAGKSGWMVLVGDSLHNFVDGILIAAAFLTDIKLGLVTAAAVVAHEIPQEVGDFMVLLNAGFSKTRALLYNLASTFSALLGGLLGYFLLDHALNWIPYLLVLASSSFIYIAVSDLMPQMQRRSTWSELFWQLALISMGVITVLSIQSLAHHHS